MPTQHALSPVFMHGMYARDRIYPILFRRLGVCPIELKELPVPVPFASLRVTAYYISLSRQ